MIDNNIIAVEDGSVPLPFPNEPQSQLPILDACNIRGQLHKFMEILCPHGEYEYELVRETKNAIYIVSAWIGFGDRQAIKGHVSRLASIEEDLILYKTYLAMNKLKTCFMMLSTKLPNGDGRYIFKWMKDALYISNFDNQLFRHELIKILKNKCDDVDEKHIISNVDACLNCMGNFTPSKNTEYNEEKMAVAHQSHEFQRKQDIEEEKHYTIVVDEHHVPHQATIVADEHHVSEQDSQKSMKLIDYTLFFSVRLKKITEILKREEALNGADQHFIICLKDELKCRFSDELAKVKKNAQEHMLKLAFTIVNEKSEENSEFIFNVVTQACTFRPKDMKKKTALPLQRSNFTEKRRSFTSQSQSKRKRTKPRKRIKHSSDTISKKTKLPKELRHMNREIEHKACEEEMRSERQERQDKIKSNAGGIYKRILKIMLSPKPPRRTHEERTSVDASYVLGMYTKFQGDMTQSSIKFISEKFNEEDMAKLEQLKTKQAEQMQRSDLKRLLSELATLEIKLKNFLKNEENTEYMFKKEYSSVNREFSEKPNNGNVVLIFYPNLHKVKKETFFRELLNYLNSIKGSLNLTTSKIKQGLEVLQANCKLPLDFSGNIEKRLYFMVYVKKTSQFEFCTEGSVKNAYISQITYNRIKSNQQFLSDRCTEHKMYLKVVKYFDLKLDPEPNYENKIFLEYISKKKEWEVNLALIDTRVDQIVCRRTTYCDDNLNYADNLADDWIYDNDDEEKPTSMRKIKIGMYTKAQLLINTIGRDIYSSTDKDREARALFETITHHDRMFTASIRISQEMYENICATEVEQNKSTIGVLQPSFHKSTICKDLLGTDPSTSIVDEPQPGAVLIDPGLRRTHACLESYALGLLTMPSVEFRTAYRHARKRYQNMKLNTLHNPGEFYLSFTDEKNKRSSYIVKHNLLQIIFGIIVKKLESRPTTLTQENICLSYENSNNLPPFIKMDYVAVYELFKIINLKLEEKRSGANSLDIDLVGVPFDGNVGDSHLVLEEKCHLADPFAEKTHKMMRLTELQEKPDNALHNENHEQCVKLKKQIGEPALKPITLMPTTRLKTGDRVQLVGIKNLKYKNKYGNVCSELNSTSGRIIVKIDGVDEPKALKPITLMPITQLTDHILAMINSEDDQEDILKDLKSSVELDSSAESKSIEHSLATSTLRRNSMFPCPTHSTSRGLGPREDEHVFASDDSPTTESNGGETYFNAPK